MATGGKAAFDCLMGRARSRRQRDSKGVGREEQGCWGRGRQWRGAGREEQGFGGWVHVVAMEGIGEGRARGSEEVGEGMQEAGDRRRAVHKPGVDGQ